MIQLDLKALTINSYQLGLSCRLLATKIATIDLSLLPFFFFVLIKIKKSDLL
jgi:hypothetical protein